MCVCVYIYTKTVPGLVSPWHCEFSTKYNCFSPDPFLLVSIPLTKIYCIYALKLPSALTTNVIN